MSGFVKLFGSIIHSTVWREPHHVLRVWVAMLAMADRDGFVESSVPGLADCARVTLNECEEALDKFRQPDPYSRSKDLDGRRIVDTEGGWLLVNFAKYRDRAYQEDRKERAAERMRDLRSRNDSCSLMFAPVSTSANNCEQLRTGANSSVSVSESASESERGESGRGGEPQVKPVRRRSPYPPSKRVPPEWQPNSAHRELARAEGRDFDRELAKFRDCEFRVAHRDWDAAFRNWLRSDFGSNARASPVQPYCAPDSDRSRRERDYQAQRKLDLERTSGGSPPPPELLKMLGGIGREVPT